jgi:hypothetical protein
MAHDLQNGLVIQTKRRCLSTKASTTTRPYDRGNKKEKEYVNPFDDPDEEKEESGINDEMLLSRNRADGEIGPGSKVMVEVTYFGPLGASADVIANGHKPENVIPFEQPPLGKTLIVQKEIDHIIEDRNDAPVIIGEVLKAVVLRVHDNTMNGFKVRNKTKRNKTKQNKILE